MTNGEFAGQMARLLKSVSDTYRQVLHLRVVVGLSVEQTAEAVGSTPGAVRVAQHRALNRLQDLTHGETVPWRNEGSDGKQRRCRVDRTQASRVVGMAHALTAPHDQDAAPIRAGPLTTPQDSLDARDRSAASPSRAFDAGLRSNPSPGQAARLQLDHLAITQTGLTPANDDEPTTKEDLRSHLRSLGARNIDANTSSWIERCKKVGVSWYGLSGSVTGINDYLKVISGGGPSWL